MLQISTLLYESVSLLIVIRISVKACIDVTLYDELFNHLHNREKFLSPLVTKDNFDCCPVIHSCITLVPHDFDKGTLSINHKVSEGKEGGEHRIYTEDKLKTKSSFRTLPLIPAMRELLITQKKKQEEKRIERKLRLVRFMNR